jgi:glutaredoxin 3
VTFLLGKLGVAIILLEEKNNNDKQHSIIIEAGVEEIESMHFIIPMEPIFTSKNNKVTRVSDSEIIDMIDEHGTYIEYETRIKDYMTIYYPDIQISANVFVVTLPETISSTTGGVIMYSINTCQYCDMAKEFFDENGIDYTEYEITADSNARAEMIEKSGQTGVPVIDVNGEVIVGFKEGELSGLLGIPK